MNNKMIILTLYLHNIQLITLKSLKNLFKLKNNKILNR